jgi:hypothetical protein
MSSPTAEAKPCGLPCSRYSGAAAEEFARLGCDVLDIHPILFYTNLAREGIKRDQKQERFSHELRNATTTSLT